MRFCSVASRRGRGVIRSSCGVAALCLPHHSPVVSFASRLSVSYGVSLFVLHALRAGAAWRACSSHRGLIVLVWRGRSWCRGVLLCLPVSSDLFFSCRRSGRSFSSRRGVSSLVSWSGEALASRLILGGSGWAAVLVLSSRCSISFCVAAFRPSFRFASRLVVLLFVSFVSSAVLLLVSSCVSSCIVPSYPFRRLVSSERGGVAWRSSSSCHNRPRSCVVPSAVPSCDASERDGLAFLSHVAGRSLPVSFYYFVIVSVGVSWRGVCGEIELTKTARLPFLSHPSHPARARLVGAMRNRTRSNDSEKRARCRSVLTPWLPYMPAGRFRKPIPCLLIPRPGGGGQYEAGGQGRAGGEGVGRKWKEENVLAFIASSLRLVLSP